MMTPDKIKERLSLLRLYLAGLLTCIFTSFIWFWQNIGNVASLNAIAIFLIAILSLLLMLATERKINRLIDLL